jgi:hypothetical protein
MLHTILSFSDFLFIFFMILQKYTASKRFWKTYLYHHMKTLVGCYSTQATISYGIYCSTAYCGALHIFIRNITISYELGWRKCDTKIVDLDEIYKFVVRIFFIWNYIRAQIINIKLRVFSLKFLKYLCTNVYKAL